MEPLDVPFYVNPDNQSCLPTCFRMILEYLNPGKTFSQEEINRMIEKKSGKWATVEPILIKLKKQGYEVREIMDFDIQEFIKRGVDYFYEKYGKEITEETYLPNYDFEASKRYKEGFGLNLIEKRKLIFEEVEEFFKQGYLVLMIVDANTLYSGKGYAGHMVILTGFDNKQVWINECAKRCPEKNKRIDKDLFIKAWNHIGTDNEVVLLKAPKSE